MREELHHSWSVAEGEALQRHLYTPRWGHLQPAGCEPRCAEEWGSLLCGKSWHGRRRRERCKRTSRGHVVQANHIGVRWHHGTLLYARQSHASQVELLLATLMCPFPAQLLHSVEEKAGELMLWAVLPLEEMRLFSSPVSAWFPPVHSEQRAHLLLGLWWASQVDSKSHANRGTASLEGPSGWSLLFFQGEQGEAAAFVNHLQVMVAQSRQEEEVAGLQFPTVEIAPMILQKPLWSRPSAQSSHVWRQHRLAEAESWQSVPVFSTSLTHWEIFCWYELVLEAISAKGCTEATSAVTCDGNSRIFEHGGGFGHLFLLHKYGCFDSLRKVAVLRAVRDELVPRHCLTASKEPAVLESSANQTWVDSFVWMALIRGILARANIAMLKGSPWVVPSIERSSWPPTKSDVCER